MVRYPISLGHSKRLSPKAPQPRRVQDAFGTHRLPAVRIACFVRTPGIMSISPTGSGTKKSLTTVADVRRKWIGVLTGTTRLSTVAKPCFG